MKLFDKIFSLFYLLFLSTNVNAAYTLKQSYESALSNTEAPKIALNAKQLADEKSSEYLGQVLPHFNLIGSYYRQDTSRIPGSSGSAFLNPDQTTLRLNLTQPLFHGLSDLYTYRSAKKTFNAKEARELQSTHTLFLKVAESYYSLLSAQTEVQNIKTSVALTEKRMAELRARTKIGRSRKGELLSAESQDLILKAQLMNAESTVVQAKESFRLLTLVPAAFEIADDNNPIQGSTASIDLLIAVIDKKPEIVALKEEYEAADQLVAAAKGGHLPSLDFNGNYFFKRPGNFSDSKWDFGLTLTLPLFNGGSTQSQLEQAVFTRKEKELSLAYAKRNAQTEVKNIYTYFKSLILQQEKLSEAVTVLEANYKEQSKDYRNGLVTNLDVLQALNSFQETKRNLDKLIYQTKTAFISLHIACGQMPSI